MSVDFSSIHNHTEQAVFAAVIAAAQRFPGLAQRPELLADAACVALNRLPPRYIRHSVHLSFYATDRDRELSDQAIVEAVDFACGFVQARVAMGARA